MYSVKELAKIIGTNIKNARLMRNYSQDYLANCLTISQNAYSKIELGKSGLTIERAFKIAEILEIPLGILIADTDKKKAMIYKEGPATVAVG